MPFFIDVQGTILSDKDKSSIRGSVEFIEFLNEKEYPYVVITNNTKKNPKDMQEYLNNKGFCLKENAYLDPFMILKQSLQDNLIASFGSPEFSKVLAQMGYVESENPSSILVSSYDDFKFDDFAKMIEFSFKGAELIGMHATSTYAKNSKRYPGVGAIMQMLKYATNKNYKIIGKPSLAFYDGALKLINKQQKETLNFKDITIISDDAIGDLLGAKELGMKTVLVLSGKTKNESEVKSIQDKIDKIYPNIQDFLEEYNEKY